MVPALIGLRAAIDRALGSLEVLAPVIEAWVISQKNGAPEAVAAQEGTPRPPDEPASPSEAPRAVTGLFDELPVAATAQRRPTNGVNGSSAPSIDHCVICGTGIRQAERGARRRYCGATCRLKAKADRATRCKVANGLDLLPDQVERPFAAVGAPDDPRSDPRLLKPPALSFSDEPA
jgi:hypothetical protein